MLEAEAPRKSGDKWKMELSLVALKFTSWSERCNTATSGKDFGPQLFQIPGMQVVESSARNSVLGTENAGFRPALQRDFGQTRTMLAMKCILWAESGNVHFSS